MKNKITAIAGPDNLKLISGNKVEIISKDEITEQKIKETLKNLGCDEESTTRFGIDDKAKPKILSAKHDQSGALVITTDQKQVSINQPYRVSNLEQGFKQLNITADDYESFCRELENQGLPRPANSHLISGGFREELSLPNLNHFKIPVEETKIIDPSLFADEQMSIGSLYAFPEVDSINLDDLFKFKKDIKESQ